MPLHLMDAWCVNCAEDGDRLTAHLGYADDNLRLANVFAQIFVELLLGLLQRDTGHMDASHQRRLDVAIAVDTDRFVTELSYLRSGNHQLVVRSKQIRGAELVVANGLWLSLLGC